MALYNEFDLDVTVGNNAVAENANRSYGDSVKECPTYTVTTYTAKPDTCYCTGDSCTGMSPRPCDR